MKNLIISFIVITVFLLSSCRQTPLIQNKERLADIKRMLEVQKGITKNSKKDIWGIFQISMTPDEQQAMQFLFAYMPLSDLADYPSTYFLANVKRSLEARSETSWGKTIPEDVFLHFVLPVRVNNENLDSFRIVMYPELKERLKGLSMKDAALEVNHWCHEKVNYRGTDSRTSAPLSTIKKTFGRCGEESTFTVSAMRAAGIPARQVYTPRWAHSDDNHAWVEVWVDGKWYYLGACEPEPELNMGWFSEPSRRTMLVHTRAYGRYFGTEDVVVAADRFSELNLTSNYTTVKNITIKVESEDGSPVDSAKVEFKLYNYAEFYPIATGYTNDKGLAGLRTGLGDLLIWAAKDGHYAYHKFSVSETDTLTLVLKPYDGKEYSENLDMVPPHAVKVENTVNEEAKSKNNRRLALEDSIRGCTIATFKDSAWTVAFTGKIKLPYDSVRPLIAKSYGNWADIAAFLETNTSKYRHFVLPFINQLSDKDLSDTRKEVLNDQLQSALEYSNYNKTIPEDIFVKYVLSPRINIEYLSSWRSFLRKEFGEEMAAKTRTDLSVLTNWIRNNIAVDKKANLHSRAPLTPGGVYNIRVADPVSRDIFFVAACRSFGIPARLNPETQVPEYWKNGSWLRAGFEAEPAAQPLQGKLQLVNGNNPILPQYYLHFTIGVYKDGFYRTLEFDEGKKLTDFSEPVTLDTGRYVLITGNRMADGSVLSSQTFFTIRTNKVSKLSVTLRTLPADLKPSGKLNFDQLTLKLLQSGKEEKLSVLANGKSMVLVVIDPDKEPSKHILNDLVPYVDHFNKWNGNFVFAMPQSKSQQAGVLKTYALPKATTAGMDVNDKMIEAIGSIYGPGLNEKLPLVLLCDGTGNVYLFSSGYKIGIGEQILKTIPTFESKASCTKK